MEEKNFATVVQLIGNEWITTPLLMKFLENLAKSYVNGINIYGQDPRQLFSEVSLYLIPMVNPDGVGVKLIGFKNSL